MAGVWRWSGTSNLCLFSSSLILIPSCYASCKKIKKQKNKFHTHTQTHTHTHTPKKYTPTKNNNNNNNDRQGSPIGYVKLRFLKL